MRDVEPEDRLAVGAGQARAHQERLRVHLVQARDQIDPLGVDRGVQLDRARQQCDLIQIAGIDTGALDAQHAVPDAKRLERAGAAKHRLAGGEHPTRSIDEAATVAGQAVRVGDDHLGARAGHFEIAVQRRWQGARDLVDDHRGAAAAQIRIAWHPAAKLRLHAGRRVVQDRAGRADIEPFVGVVRYATGRRRGDVHQRHAVGRGVHPRCRAPRARIRHDLANGHVRHEQHRRRRTQCRCAP
ncbi:hypothetical protein PTE30175_04704 [Pandoraea terrae]|uniref:Uncharacterized protein n=1 Tax=Pandoraea terrae TaxID=1537710 RepID=A0A5E4YX82_9BURK|nr:hypothetical protein PTE30175_04704 [Pandoraea terrae]